MYDEARNKININRKLIFFNIEKEYESKTNYYYEQKNDFPIVVIARNDSLPR